MTEEIKTAADDGKPAPKVEPRASDKQENHEDDSIKWRSKYKVAKEELETAKAKTESEKQELATRVDSLSKEREMYEKKYIDAELKAHAVAAGIKDLDFVKLIERGDIKLDEKGNVVGAEKVVADWKEKKPEWFGAEKKASSSSNAPFPDTTAPKALDARTISKEDWRRNKANYMAGQFK